MFQNSAAASIIVVVAALIIKNWLGLGVNFWPGCNRARASHAMSVSLGSLPLSQGAADIRKERRKGERTDDLGARLRETQVASPVQTSGRPIVLGNERGLPNL